MSSKMERWKRISADTGGSESTKNPNKAELLKSFSTVPISETSEQDQKEDEDKDNIVVESDSIKKDSIEKDKDGASVGVESESMEYTPKDSKEMNSKKSDKKTTRKARAKSTDSPVTDDVKLIERVNKNVKSLVDSRVLKESQFKKTSYNIKFINLAKLHNFDRAHGGRIKGEFINNLLEEFFAELEADPSWNKILNYNIDEIIDRMKGGNYFDF